MLASSSSTPRLAVRCLCSLSGAAPRTPAPRAGPAFMRKRHQSTRVPGHDYLHLHALPTSGKPRYALSYFPSPPLHEASPTVLGIVNGERVTPAAFEENPEWRPMLHELLKHSVWSDEVLQVQANSRVEGYLHIIDERNMPAINRAGEPEDIVASLLCRDGKLLEGEYEAGDAYRIVTANGPMQLSKTLTESLIRGLQVARSVEEQMQAEGAE